MKSLQRHLRALALIVFLLALAPAARATIYYGNGDTGFGGAIGNGILTLTDDGTNISGIITRGTGLFNDVLVLYIDSVPGGYADTSGFADNFDGFHQAISGFDGGANRSVLTNAPGFAADYAVAINSSFGGLWGLTNGGYASLPYITSVNVSPAGTDSAGAYTFSFPVSAIGLTPGGGGTFKLVGTYVSVSGYRSTEAVAGNVSGTQGWNPFNVTVSTNYTIQTKPLVLNTNDNGPGSLRYVVTNVAPGTVITFATNLSGATITLTSGELVVNQDLTIDASALTNGISINGNHSSRIFSVAAGSTSTFAGLTLTNGNSVGAINSGEGGAIYSAGVLTLTNCTLSGNSASVDGGGIFNGGSGSLTVNQSTLAGNSASQFGGGIYNNGGTLTVNSCTIANNTASGGFGGGIETFGTLNLKLTNSIVSLNTGVDIAGNPYSSSSNLIGNATALLAPLGNYGGPTQTMPPLPGSPAIGAGSVSAASQFATDQRGLPRTVNGLVDIGAVEAGDAIPGYNYTVVTVTNDFVSALTNNGVSLREAVAFATNGATITFATNLSGATILLTNATGALVLNQNLTIDASALANGISLNGNHVSRVFYVTNATVALNSLSITNGASGSSLLGYGGGIYNDGGGNLTLSNCVVAGSTAAAGGGIFTQGAALVLNNCSVSGNATSVGGGLLAQGAAVLNNSTFSGNSASTKGGALSAAFNTGTPVVANECTFSGNNAPTGAGIYNNTGGVVLNQCTVCSNTASASAGGVYNNSTFTLSNSIVAGNSAPASPNIQLLAGTFQTGGVNLTNATPLLAALGNYGGPTQTMPPLPGSPAIDGCTNGAPGFATDQRGFPRLVGAHVDIGAVEGVYSANYSGPGRLIGATRLGNGAGAFQFGFTNYPDLNTTFSVWASTNLALPFSQWSNLGAITDAPPGSGHYQFTDPHATNYSRRFYQVTSP